MALAVALALVAGGCKGPGGSPWASPAAPVVRPTLSADFVGRIDGSTATIPMMTAALRLLRGTDDGMRFNTTDAAYQNLIAGSKDVIFVTAPSDDELQAAKDAGLDLEVIPIVKDALVFLANTVNPVDGLTSQQIRDVYSGVTTNWRDVGGDDMPIVAYQRPENSGSQTLFEQLAMDGVTPMNAPDAIRPGGMDGLMDVISTYNNSAEAIGYSVFYYTQEMYVKDNVKLLGIDGVKPTRQTIAGGSYPYVTNYYAVMRSDEPTGSTARQLVDWCLSQEGQRTFSAASYVPLDASNIVPPNNGYGYDGSTLQNTTQSSGTGGPAGQVAPFGSYDCSASEDQDCVTVDDQGNYLGISVPGHPAAQKAAEDWFANLPPANLPDIPDKPDWMEGPTVGYSGYASRGLLFVARFVTVAIAIETTLSNDTAIFRLSDGHRMTLSDFFYDGVNYIDFINRNLLDETTNDQLNLCLQGAAHDSDCLVGERAAPFTGIPADTMNFSYAEAILTIHFPAGNPFLIRNDWEGYPVHADSYVDINLPADLSPYGAIWRIEQMPVGSVTVDHIVSNYQGTNPRDAVLNQNIDTWVKSLHKKKGAVIADIFSADSGFVVDVTYVTSDMNGGFENADFDLATGKRVTF